MACGRFIGCKITKQGNKRKQISVTIGQNGVIVAKNRFLWSKNRIFAAETREKFRKNI